MIVSVSQLFQYKHSMAHFYSIVKSMLNLPFLPPAPFASTATMPIWNYTKADQLRWLRDDIRDIRKQLKVLRALPIPVRLATIGDYHQYWQKYHCFWNYDDYSEDFPFERFLIKLRAGYKSRTVRRLKKEQVSLNRQLIKEKSN